MPKSKHLVFIGIYVLLAGITWLVYAPGLSGPFMFDDLTNILLVKTTYLKNLDFASLQNTAWALDSGPLSRPIAALSFGLNYYFTQLDVYFFKLTNLLIHIFTGYALYQLTYRLIARLPEKPTHLKVSHVSHHYLGLIACAMWLVHPLNITSVLYVVQRMTSLSSLFMVLGLVGYVVGREQIIADEVKGYATIALSMICLGTLAIFTKEIGVLLPLYAMLIEIYFFHFAASERLSRSFKKFWYGFFVIPFVIALVIAAVKSGTLLALDAYENRNFTLPERLLTESRIIWFYLRLIVLPAISQMGTYHDDIPLSTGLLSPASTLLSLIGLALLVVIAVLGRKKITILSFGIAWFLVGHSLESTVIPLELAHEHRNYLPLFGIVLILVYYATHTAKKISNTIKIRYLLLLGYICLLSIVTYARASDWRDEWTLFNAEVRNHPQSARSHTAIGVLYYDNKMYTQAEKHFRLAAELEKKELEPELRLAQFEVSRQGRVSTSVLEELNYRIQNYKSTTVALWAFQRLIDDSKKYPELHRKIIGLYEKLVRSSGAGLDKKWLLAAYYTLAESYDMLGQPDKVVEYYVLSVGLEPTATYYIKTAIQYAEHGKKDLAEKLLRAVIEKNLVVADADKALLIELERILNRKNGT